MAHNQQAEKKKAYQSPELRSYGNITQLTLAASKTVGIPDDDNKGNADKHSAI